MLPTHQNLNPGNVLCVAVLQLLGSSHRIARNLDPGQCPVRGRMVTALPAVLPSAPSLYIYWVHMSPYIFSATRSAFVPLFIHFRACGPEPSFGRLAPFTNRQARAGLSYHVERGNFSSKFQLLPLRCLIFCMLSC